MFIWIYVDLMVINGYIHGDFLECLLLNRNIHGDIYIYIYQYKHHEPTLVTTLNIKHPHHGET